jgi:hypothetical protein
MNLLKAASTKLFLLLITSNTENERMLYDAAETGAKFQTFYL